MNKKLLYGLSAASLIAAGLSTALSQRLTVRFYTEISEKIGTRIRLAVLTDLHSSIYGERQKILIRMIQRQNPDIVLLAGDIADDKVPNNGTIQLLSVIGRQYPCFYVAGNHEFRTGKIHAVKAMVRSFHVHILEGSAMYWTVRGEHLCICGVDDPTGFPLRTSDGRIFSSWEEQLQCTAASKRKDAYTVLLTHRPERAEQYRSSGFDLVIAGHAHGGQVRIPGVLNGLYAPQQGLFPKYAGGRYQLGETAMIVSRGLCKTTDRVYTIRLRSSLSTLCRRLVVERCLLRKMIFQQIHKMLQRLLF